VKIVSPENEVDVICSKMQLRHRSGIGMTFKLITAYTVKIDSCNMTDEVLRKGKILPSK
jgi:hypothetical protein